MQLYYQGLKSRSEDGTRIDDPRLMLNSWELCEKEQPMKLKRHFLVLFSQSKIWCVVSSGSGQQGQFDGVFPLVIKFSKWRTPQHPVMCLV